jgi:hypothetical protein
MMGTCFQLLPAGQACTSDEECASGFCGTSGAGKTCRANLVLPADGCEPFLP